MDRRNFIKCIGGTSLTMFCLDNLAQPLSSDLAEDNLFYIRPSLKHSYRFPSDGKLKIVQFTDCHYKSEDKFNSQPSLKIMEEVLNTEKPDFVIYTGDLVFSNGTYEGLDAVLEPVISRKIPFAVVFGNHDDEFDHTRQELYDYVQKKEGAIMPKRATNEVPDFVIPILSSSVPEKVVSLLFCIDSHSYSKMQSVSGYDWIHYSQIDWYRKVSSQFTAANSGIPLPALAFFHIAIPEYHTALTDNENRVFGIKAEGVCCPKINSGFFTAVKECGDIMAMFVGHDHDNDYATMLNNVMLAYGRYSGGNTVYNDIPNGARVIVLYEGQHKLDSYIRLANNTTNTFITYPDSFIIQNCNKPK